MKKTILALCIPLIAGCAHFPLPHQDKPDNSTIASYVAPEIPPQDAAAVAEDMARFLSLQLPPAKTTLELEPGKTEFHYMLVEELMKKGFGVIEDGAEGESVSLRYFVTSLDDGVLIRLKYDHRLAGRYYDRADAGNLSFGNAYAVREATQ